MPEDKYSSYPEIKYSSYPMDFNNRFVYHPPKDDQGERYAYLRSEAKHLAAAICKMTPSSREQSLALTKVEEAVMWANAAVSRNE